MENNLVKILITGANGFIGQRLTKYLGDRGYRLTAVVKQKRWEYKNITFIEGDLLDIDQLNMRADEFQIVIHLAACLLMYERRERLFNGNYKLTKNLLNIFGKNKPYFIFFSSIDAFGPTGAGEVNEDDEPKPVTDYGKIKLKTERLVRESGFPYAILRLGNVVTEDRGIKESVKRIIEGGGVKNKLQNWLMRNALNQFELNFINIDDINRVVEKLIQQRPKNQLYFLVGQSSPVGKLFSDQKYCNCKITRPMLVLFCWISRLMKLPNLVCYIASGGFKRKYRRYSNDKLKKELNHKNSQE